MNKQEAIEKIEGSLMYELTRHIGKAVNIYDVIDIVKQIDEPEKPVVPKCVAEWIEKTKKIYNLYGAMGHIKDNSAPSEIMKWFSTNPTLTGEILARAWLDSYEIEEEKKYRVILKGNSESPDYLVDTVTDGFRFYNNIYTDKREHTRKELEANGFGWVFDCDGIEVEEVE